MDRTILGLALAMSVTSAALAQDVPGIEICTVDKTMERRTSCLQSNVEFLVKTINKVRLDHDQKLDATARQIETLRNAIIGLQKTVADLQAAPAKPAPAATKDAPVARDQAPLPKDGAK